jgi:hypothetical protein
MEHVRGEGRIYRVLSGELERKRPFEGFGLTR